MKLREIKRDIDRNLAKAGREKGGERNTFLQVRGEAKK
jgi:hypothetical protein